KELMREPLKNGEIKIIPEYFDKTYFHWIENLRDWCISRQIWYGHRVPVWYRSTSLTASSEDEVYCGVMAPEGEGWKQDEDTLDTWFSSGMWTFSTLGWPEQTTDLKTYHPTDVLETGSEILFFWVARMVLMSEYVLGEIPFKTIYLHGTVRDGQGRKMSKSLGNGIDPLDIAQKFGADAGRIALVTGTAPGTDSRIDENKIKGYKNFANKIWNITRFILENTKDTELVEERFEKYTEKDRKFGEERHDVMVDITKDMEEYRFHLASEKIYQYTWHTLADVILEDSKKIFENGKTEEIISRKQFLLHTLDKILKILHPFMPFVTEEIWSMIPAENKKLLIVEKWPISTKND
ncbi:MAG: class I tRNA ligase family protein, partial [Minisyncoccia bacterium]